jgi:hypothetical protein
MTCNNGQQCFTPETTLPACDNLGSPIQLQGLVVGAGGNCNLDSGGISLYESLCSAVSGPNEYVAVIPTPGSTLYFTTYSSTEDIGNIANCDQNKCAGYSLFSGCTGNCTRNSFVGDPLQCCFGDLTCAGGNDQFCFSYSTSSTNPSATCAPDIGSVTGTRNITNSTCSDVVLSYCTGQDLEPSDDSWIFRWINPDGSVINPSTVPLPGQPSTNRGCYYAYLRNLYSATTEYCPTQFPPNGTPPAPVPLSVSGLENNQNLMAAVFARYQQNGFVIGSIPGTQGYSVFQNFLFDTICSQNPEVCASALQVICSQYTADRLTFNPELSFFCGCYLPNAEYDTYAELYSINKECTPMCNRNNVIPLVDGAGNVLSCQQGVCLIDNITINLIDSQVGNGVSFGNFCNSCTPTSQCNCTISGTTIDVVNTTIGGSVVLNNGCSQTLCIENTPNGPASVPCSQSGTNPTKNVNDQLASDYLFQSKTWFWIIMMIIVIFFVLIFIFMIIIGPNFLS